MEIRMVDLKGQYEGIKEEVDTAIQNVINDSAFIKGKYVKDFQNSLSDYLNVKHVISCGNGTDALQLALMAKEYAPGSEVITTPFTFVATVEVICLLGLKPVFVDVDPDTFNIDPSKIESAITSNTKCLLPVHLFGQSAEMAEIMAIAEKHGLDVIEDSAQAIGANYSFAGEQKFCGSIGDIGTFSFFPSKNLGCYGDGGAIITNDDDLAHKMNLYANHGSLKKYYYESIGINSRLDGLQAAILNVKLRHLNDYTSSRQAAAVMYDNLLGNIPGLTLPKRIANGNHVFHQYTIKVDSGRDEVAKVLKAKGIPTGIYYPEPLYNQSIYKSFVADESAYPVTDQLCKQVLSLPMHTELTIDMQEYIAESIEDSVTVYA